MGGWKRVSSLQAGGPLHIMGTELDLRRLPTRGSLVLCIRRSKEGAAAVSKRLGLELPQQPNRGSQGSETALWLGPGRWLIFCDLASISTLRTQLESALERSIHLLADVTDARTVFAVAGANAPGILAKLCAIDLHPAVFRAGTCAQTLLVRIPALLYRPGEALCYELLVDRSFAHYAWDWVSDAAREFVGRETTR